MSKYVIYCPKSDQFMMENNVVFTGTEAELSKVLKHEIVDAKRYEIKPIKFFKSWELKKIKEEENDQINSFKFSPPKPEFYYKKPDDQPRYLLILGKEQERRSGQLVKAFDNVAEAVKMATRSIQKVSKELPDYAYFILDSERYDYVAEINQKGITEYEQFRESR
jgi:hypothetical protein